MLTYQRKERTTVSNYILSCCSTADISKEHFERRNIQWLPFHYVLDGKEYPDDLGQTMSFEAFYEAMANGADTKTSQVNVEEFTNYFESFLSQGHDVLHISFSSGLSGTCQSANIAAAGLMEKYPERKLYVVDSLAASSGYGLMMDELADMRDEGKTMEELRDFVEANRLKMRHYFFSTDLAAYVRGGRISKTSGFVGTLLGICPLLDMDGNGKLCPREKVRSKKKVIARIVEKMAETAKDGTNYSGKCYMCNSACPEDADAVAELVRKTFPNLKGDIIINSIGTTIGSHTGKGTVAVFYWSEEDRI